MKKDLFKAKAAFDKNGKKIGKVLKIKTIPESATEEVTVQIVVQKRFLLSRALTITFPSENVLKVERNDLWLNITKEEFDDFIAKSLAIRDQMIRSAKFAEASSTNKASALGFTWGKV
jgi:hypothetical protein